MQAPTSSGHGCSRGHRRATAHKSRSECAFAQMNERVRGWHFRWAPPVRMRAAREQPRSSAGGRTRSRACAYPGPTPMILLPVVLERVHCMSRRRSRTSFSNALRDILCATEDLVDDALDRAGDFECGLRDSVSRALDDDDRDHHDRDCRDRDCRDRDHHDRDCRDRDCRDRGCRDRDCRDWDCRDWDDCDDDDDDWDRRHGRRNRRGERRRRGDRSRRRLGPDEGEPYRSGTRPGPRRGPDDDRPGGNPDELTALKDQLELLRGRMDRRREGDHPGGRGRVPGARGAEDAEALRDELTRLADRIDRIRDGR